MQIYAPAEKKGKVLSVLEETAEEYGSVSGVSGGVTGEQMLAQVLQMTRSPRQLDRCVFPDEHLHTRTYAHFPPLSPQ